jgi:flavin-dependent dehydrogenase
MSPMYTTPVVEPPPTVTSSPGPWPEQVDVVILGAGLAGQTLSRHLMLYSGKTVMLLEKREEIPSKRQKYGESSVQVSGNYFSRVLDLEEYLFLEHFIKYNLRFYWKTNGAANDTFEDYSQSYIRQLSNVASYQLNRNTFEGEILRRNLQNTDRFTFILRVKDLKVELQALEDGDHRVSFVAAANPNDGEAAADQPQTVRARWVVDCTGRGRFMARQKDLTRESPIQHGSFFWWVEGLVDIEKLTNLSTPGRRRHPRRQKTGHLPSWLATNHFCEEGLWFWVIPLQHKTSLGLVFDRAVIDHKDVFSVEKVTKWVSEHFPLFADDLAKRKVLDFSGLQSYAHECVQTIYPERWGLVGEAGRFNDPLYSPGSDLISIYNTLMVDAICTDDPEELRQKCQLSESMMKAVYHAYVPTYAQSYDCLGDQEAFILKYSWELSIYFAFYVFPFINDFFTERRFVLPYLRLFSRLGPINRGVQQILSGFFQWKKAQGLTGTSRPHHVDFMEITTLMQAEKTFYQVGIDPEEARKVLTGQLNNLEELARFVVCHVASVMLDEPRIRESQAFADAIDLEAIAFDVDGWAAAWERVAADKDVKSWRLDPLILDRFRPEGDVRWPESAMRLKGAMPMTCLCQEGGRMDEAMAGAREEQGSPASKAPMSSGR